MFNGESARLTVLQKHCDGLSTFAHQTYLFRAGDVAFQPHETMQEAGENMMTRDALMEKVLRWLGHMFLEGIGTVI